MKVFVLRKLASLFLNSESLFECCRALAWGFSRSKLMHKFFWHDLKSPAFYSKFCSIATPLPFGKQGKALLYNFNCKYLATPKVSPRIIVRSRPDVFYKNGVLRNFAKFTGNILYQSLYFNKVAGLDGPYHIGLDCELMDWFLYDRDLRGLQLF